MPKVKVVPILTELFLRGKTLIEYPGQGMPYNLTLQLTPSSVGKVMTCQWSANWGTSQRFLAEV